jgi:hypothetical protein
VLVGLPIPPGKPSERLAPQFRRCLIVADHHIKPQAPKARNKQRGFTADASYVLPDLTMRALPGPTVDHRKVVGVLDVDLDLTWAVCVAHPIVTFPEVRGVKLGQLSIDGQGHACVGAWVYSEFYAMCLVFGGHLIIPTYACIFSMALSSWQKTILQQPCTRGRGRALSIQQI